MDDLKAKGFRAFVWDFLGKMARHGTGFIVTIFLARLLEPSDFGLIAMIMVFVYVAMIFTDVGLGGALIQRRKVLPVHYASVFYFNIFVGAILTLMVFFFATVISDFYENEKLIPITQVLSTLFLINAFGSIQTNKLRRELNYSALAKAEVSAAVLSGVTGVTIAFYGAGVWSLVVQALLRAVFYNIFVWIASQWIPSLLFSFKALRQLWGFGFRMFLSQVLEVIFSRLDIIIIGKLFAPAILGFFDQAKRLKEMIIQYSSGSIMAIMFPVLSKLQNDLPRFQNVVIKTLGIISFIIFFLLGIMYLISEEMIVLLFTDKWLPSVDYFKILVFSGFGYPISALLVNILSSRGNSRVFLKLEIYKKLLLVINLYVGFLWGIEGYLYGLIIMSVLGISLNMLFASREISLGFLTFAKPPITQMIISVFSVWMTLLVFENIEVSKIVAILIKGVIFTMFYLFISRLFKTNSYIYIMNQFIPIFKRKFNIITIVNTKKRD